MGGLAVAATLRRIGADVHVYEQARQFARVGAGMPRGAHSAAVAAQAWFIALLRGEKRLPLLAVDRQRLLAFS